MMKKSYARKKQRMLTPEIPQLEAELNRINLKSRFRKLLRSTVYMLIVVASAAVLIAVLFMPVLRIYGSSMNPTLSEGQIVICLKYAKIEQGDVVGVYFGNKLLIKRCIATAAQWVDIDRDGNVSVDNQPLDEPYLVEKSFGEECNIELPYQVPADALFLMGDHRKTSIDSRSTSVGCVDTDNIVGKIVFRVWPLNDFGPVR